MSDTTPTPLGAIRQECRDCSGSALEIRRCSVVTGPWWSYHLGQRSAAVRRTDPRLVDRVFDLLVGAVDGRPGELDYPRQYFPGLLATVPDADIAAAVQAIRDTTPAVRFALWPRSVNRVPGNRACARLRRSVDVLEGSAGSEADQPTPGKNTRSAAHFLARRDTAQ